MKRRSLIQISPPPLVLISKIYIYIYYINKSVIYYYYYYFFTFICACEHVCTLKGYMPTMSRNVSDHLQNKLWDSLTARHMEIEVTRVGAGP
jgi:hypothetical protein